MYDFFYCNGENHPNCFNNINSVFGTKHPIIRPINLFMYTRINVDGSIEVCAPLSKASDKIILEVLADVTWEFPLAVFPKAIATAENVSPLRLSLNNQFSFKQTKQSMAQYIAAMLR